MWPPASKIRYRDDACMIFSQYRLYSTSIIEDNSLYLFYIYFSRILDSPQSRQNAKRFLQSFDGSPSHLLAGEGVGSPNLDEGIYTVVL